MVGKAKVTRSSGNVFADLGFDNPEDEHVKAKLVVALREEIKALGLSQTAAGDRIGLSQPDVSKLLRGQVTGYTLDRLFGFFRTLGSDVEIRVKKPKKNKDGKAGRYLLEVA